MGMLEKALEGGKFGVTVEMAPPKGYDFTEQMEAAELLEVFQWSADDVRCAEKVEKIREELADVVNYCILMADACGLDLDEIVQEKIRKNAEKYPVEKAYGSKEKYTELKTEHRGGAQ